MDTVDRQVSAPARLAPTAPVLPVTPAAPIAPAAPARPPRVFPLAAGRARQLRLMAAFVGALGVATSAALLAMGSGPASDPTRLVAALVPEIAAAIVVTLLIRQIARVRLIVTEDGVEYHGFGGSIRARWDDIVALGPVANGPLMGYGLLVRNAMERGSLLSRLGGTRVGDGRGQPERGIPLEPFVMPVRGSWLELEMRRRAPRLGVADGGTA
ncbi:MAG: PH domain-containing protein [Chloroflexota bacterium]|nr:PH domain-containing protein [Chloroflexota bacterium]